MSGMEQELYLSKDVSFILYMYTLYFPAGIFNDWWMNLNGSKISAYFIFINNLIF